MKKQAQISLVIGTVCIIYLLGWWHSHLNGYPLFQAHQLRVLTYFSVLYSLTAYGVGLPDQVTSLRVALARSLLAAATTITIISLTQLVVGEPLMPRLVLVGSLMLLPVWHSLCAHLSNAPRRNDGAARTRVLLIANREEEQRLRQSLNSDPERPARLIARLDVWEATSEDKDFKPIVKLHEQSRANLIVLGKEAQIERSIISQASELHQRGVRVRTLMLFYGEYLGRVPLSECETLSLMFDISELHRRGYNRWKRLLDLTFAAAGGVGLAVLIPLILAINMIANPGALFFRQQRVGKNGKEFEIIKFRTMLPTVGDRWSWTTPNDQRVTPFGRFLRRSHLDELPQVINILRGELSVVGPRPEQPRYVQALSREIPFYSMRHLVKPGLSGWAQVKQGYASNENDAVDKLQLEFYYLYRQSLGLDALILLRTTRRVLGRTGR